MASSLQLMSLGCAFARNLISIHLRDEAEEEHARQCILSFGCDWRKV